MQELTKEYREAWCLINISLKRVVVERLGSPDDHDLPFVKVIVIDKSCINVVLLDLDVLQCLKMSRGPTCRETINWFLCEFYELPSKQKGIGLCLGRCRRCHRGQRGSTDLVQRILLLRWWIEWELIWWGGPGGLFPLPRSCILSYLSGTVTTVLSGTNENSTTSSSVESLCISCRPH